MTEQYERLGQQFGFSTDAVSHLAEAMARGNGTMAQFNHPELGGMGQWQSGGMLMIGDMFNNQLKANVGALCEALQSHISTQPIQPIASPISTWWPAEYGSPTASGGQNDRQYAYFAEHRRIVVNVAGNVTIYDTADHNITGFSQQNGRWSFNSQLGIFTLDLLKTVDKLPEND